MRPKRGLEGRGRRPVSLGRPIEPRVPGPSGSDLATATARVTAYLLDSLFVGVATLGLWWATQQVGGAGGSVPFQSGRTAANLVIEAAYLIALWSGGRRTIGMRLCRIRVVRVPDGGPVSIPAAAVRWAVLIIPGLAIDTLLRMRSDLIGDAFVLYFALALAWPIILLASMFRSPTRQGLHDRAAGTAVIAWW